MLDPTDQVVVTLRRFNTKTPCGRKRVRYPGHYEQVYDYHDVEIEIAREVGTIESCLDGDHTGRTVAVDDPRWPTSCACGYIFTDADMKQESRTRLYSRRDTGELYTISDAPAGALYDSGAFKDVEGYQRNGDGMSLVCKTPAGEWLMDGPSSNGPGWTRTGTPPDITVTPSIGIGRPQHMHGWLRNGWLEIDMP